ncbi:MAG TPA: hypothetical protein VFV68_04435 [Agriterribacter sp.]|nr:hypothetical protein [Agriterribacter sp.]
MRHLTAILLILTFLFNLFGYRLLLPYWELKEQANLYVNIGQQNNGEDLVEMQLKNRSSRDAFFSLIDDLQNKSDDPQTPRSSFSFHFGAVDCIYQDFDNCLGVTPGKAIFYGNLTASSLISAYITSLWQPPDLHCLASQDFIKKKILLNARHAVMHFYSSFKAGNVK